MRELQIITDYYGNDMAQRSGLPLIKHIHDGLEIIDELGDDPGTEVLGAWCLHPIVQEQVSKGIGEFGYLVDQGCRSECVTLAAEYSVAANSYLCTDDKELTAEEIAKQVGILSREVALMLLADKCQNMRDFYLYHWRTHPKSDRYVAYFDLWIDYLTDMYPVEQ